MDNIILIKELVDSMENAVLKLEKAIGKKDKNEANRLRILIIELHKKIDKALEKKDV